MEPLYNNQRRLRTFFMDLCVLRLYRRRTRRSPVRGVAADGADRAGAGDDERRARRAEDARAAAVAALGRIFAIGAKRAVFAHVDHDLHAGGDGEAGPAVVGAPERDVVRDDVDRAVRERLRGVIGGGEPGGVGEAGPGDILYNLYPASSQRDFYVIFATESPVRPE